MLLTQKTYCEQATICFTPISTLPLKQKIVSSGILYQSLSNAATFHLFDKFKYNHTE